ncbi:amino acid ABC transporter permease [Gordonia sp. CPCC 205333]|uniref:amino acid ABC transporter permease n=1 Tax=Gordonia sp. CPCC 205333 TaxID=3140790 RepID=UPI003AF3EFE0
MRSPRPGDRRVLPHLRRVRRQVRARARHTTQTGSAMTQLSSRTSVRDRVDSNEPPSVRSATTPTTTDQKADRYVVDPALAIAPLVGFRRPGRWIGAAVVAVLAAMLIHSLLTNSRFHWEIVGNYFVNRKILDGLVITLWLTLLVSLSGGLLAILVGAARLSSNPLVRSISWGFVWIVRSVPPLVQILFWFEIAALYPQLSIGIPFGPEFATTSTATLFTPFLAAYIALTIDVAAFGAEVVRGGILAVDHGQTEAAKSIGLGPIRSFRRIILPQAMPSILPAAGNLLIGTLKGTSLVSVIAVQDLLGATELIYNDNFQVIPLLLVASIWYIVITSVLSIGQFFVERRYSRGKRGHQSLAVIFRGNLPLFGRTFERKTV